MDPRVISVMVLIVAVIMMMIGVILLAEPDGKDASGDRKGIAAIMIILSAIPLGFLMYPRFTAKDAVANPWPKLFVGNYYDPKSG